jgi:hypothetical protein
MNIYPYVYRIDHPNGEFYIGSRCANKVPAKQDLGIKYKTSSKSLTYPFEEYKLTIIAEFFNDTAKQDAYDLEQKLIFENWNNPLLENKICHYGKTRFSTAGTKLSDEHRKKLIGKKISKKARQKMSESKQGKPLSEEHKQKISRSTKGIKRSSESRQKMSDSWKLRSPMSDEHKQKISNSNKGKTLGKKRGPMSEEHKQKIAEALRGKSKSNEHKKSMSVARKKWLEKN